MNIDKQIYIVKNVKDEAEGVKTLSFVPKAGEKMMHHAGQFLRVALLDNPHNLASKPYSISSAPEEEYLAISVKKVGPFSSALHDLKTGDEVEIAGPFGSMKMEDHMEEVVFVAGGIGSAPFFSMIKNMCKEREPQRDITFFYSNKTHEHTAFYEQLKELEKEYTNFKLVHILTQEDDSSVCVSKADEYKRFDIKMLKKYISDIHTPHYFVCGTVSFVTEISKILEQEHIDSRKIFSELFY